MNTFSTLLASTPSFLTGFGQALDLGATMHSYNVSSTPQEADRIALANDWCIVGNAISEAMTEYAK